MPGARPRSEPQASEANGEGGIRTLEGLTPLAVFKFSSMGSPAHVQFRFYQQ